VASAGDPEILVASRNVENSKVSVAVDVVKFACGVYNAIHSRALIVIKNHAPDFRGRRRLRNGSGAQNEQELGQEGYFSACHFDLYWGTE
jgi:hypothetical protein